MGDGVTTPSRLHRDYDRVTEWRPARLITEEHTGNDFTLLVLNQPLNNLELLKIVWKKGKRRPSLTSQSSLTVPQRRTVSQRMAAAIAFIRLIVPIWSYKLL